jgi:hypothetical protein
MSKPGAPPAVGIQWPITGGQDRSTTSTSQKIWKASFQPLDAKTADEIAKEKNWRFKYPKYIVEHVKASLKSKDAALEGARAGLDAMYDSFEFIRDGETLKFSDAMKKFVGKKTFHTSIILGNKPKPSQPQLEVPYKNKNLSGEALISQLKRWSDYGTIEKSAADAIGMVAQHPEWANLSNRTFVLLGALAEMGPLRVLLSLGANVIAVDLDRPGIWERLIGIAKDSCGTLTFPTRVPESDLKDDKERYKQAGCDLMKNPRNLDLAEGSY